MAEIYAHVLYEGESLVPVICERKSWKRCPEHKHLTEERPDGKEVFFNTLIVEPFVDDPDDDIISIAEYGATSVAEEYVPPVHEDFKPAVWEPHTDSEDTAYDKQGGVGKKVLKTLGAVAGAAGIALLLSGCGASTGMTTGTIVDSSFTPAHSAGYRSCVSTKPLICNTIRREHPDKWTITVEAKDGSGKTVTKVLEVEEPVFNDTQVGDGYNFTPEQVEEYNHDIEMDNTRNGIMIGVTAAVGGAVSFFGGWVVVDKINDMRYNRKAKKESEKQESVNEG